MWEAPDNNGGRVDLFYIISQNVTNNILITSNTNITLTELLPSSYYQIRVTADNGVSSQDSNVAGRTLAIFIMTLKGSD